MRALATRLVPFAAAVVAAGLAVHVVEARGVVNAYWLQIFELACVVSISALGLNVVYGHTGLFSLGHAAFYGIGAYACAYLVKEYGVESQAAFGAALLAGALLAGAVAFLIGVPALRLSSDYLGIATLGFGIIAKVVFDNADGFLPPLGGARGMTGIARMTTGPWAVGALCVATAAVRNLVHSSHGRALASIREDGVAAEAMGIATFRTKLAGFAFGCALAGLAGGLYAHLYSFLHPSNFDFFKSVDVLMIVVIGGLGNVSGTLAASFGWIFLLEGLRVLLPPEAIELRWVLIPVLLIVTMLLRPQGLFGSWEFPGLRGDG